MLLTGTTQCSLLAGGLGVRAFAMEASEMGAGSEAAAKAAWLLLLLLLLAGCC
jgi:hypothetical protein